MESQENQEQKNSLETKLLTKNWPLVSVKKEISQSAFILFVGESKVSFIVFSDTAIRFLIFIKTKFT